MPTLHSPPLKRRTNKSLTPPLKWHGGKWYLARKIIDLMPPRCSTPNSPRRDDQGWLHYVEPYFGGGSVMLANDPEGISEVVGDANGSLTTFWRVLRDSDKFTKFVRIIEAVPFSEQEWTDAVKHLKGTDPVSRAVAFYIRCRQSLAGRNDSFAPLSKNRTRRAMNEQASAWLNAVEGLEAVHSRLKRVAILNRPAVDVIRQQDGPKTLFYCDPPYLPETRSAREVYGEFEMSKSDHSQLLATLKECSGKVMLSGYPSQLYDRTLRDWNRHTFDLPNNSAGGKTKNRATEVVWCNF